MSGESLAEHMAWLHSLGMGECTCPFEWRGLGRLYGTSMGKGWVRMRDEPGCPEHGRRGSHRMEWHE